MRNSWLSIKKTNIWVFLFLGTLILLLIVSGFTESETKPTPLDLSEVETLSKVDMGWYTLERVVDGDTVIVNSLEGRERVRLIGIDTPELARQNRPEECYAQEATNRLQEILSQNSQLRLWSDPTQDEYDRFGRLLAYITIEDGVNVNELLVREGYAREFTYENPYLLQEVFIEAEQEAQDNGLGLWSACVNSAF